MEYLPAGALCGRHPTVRAVAVCSRCGGFLCSHCLDLKTGRELCEPCRMNRGPLSVPWSAIWAVLAGLLGLSLAPFGVAAIIGAAVALDQATGEQRPRPKLLAALAVALALMGFGITAAMVRAQGG